MSARLSKTNRETATVTSSFGLLGVELYNLGGALLLSQSASGLSHTLDLRPYPSGEYVCFLHSWSFFLCLSIL